MPNSSSSSPLASKVERCIIHIGTEKTGSKTIQHFLTQRREELKDVGVLYPRLFGADNRSQWEFVAATHPAPWEQDVGRSFGIRNADDQNSFARKLASTLTRELNETNNIRTMIISSEHFHSRFSQDAPVQALYDFISEWTDNIEILVYFRRQDEVALSFQSTRLKSSVQLEDLSLFGDGRGPIGYYDYYSLYQRWKSVFGHDSIGARLFSRDAWHKGDLIHDFLNAAKIEIKASKLPPQNRSLSREGFQFLQAINRLYPQTPGDERDRLRAALVKHVSDNFQGKFYPIQRSEVERFLMQFEETNEKVRECLFPDYQAPLFGTDLSEYPESLSDLSPQYDDAVRIAFSLWSDVESNRKVAFWRRLLKRWQFIK